MAQLTTETQDVRIPVQFECPHCDQLIEQTKKNRELPKIECPQCKKTFSTQWASTAEEKALPAGTGCQRTVRKRSQLWQQIMECFAVRDDESGRLCVRSDQRSRFDNGRSLDPQPIVHRRAQVTENLDRFKYADATRELYDFAWDQFCSFYVEMLKDRFADQSKRAHAQRMLAYSLDTLLRLLHPFIPFITEEIWQQLAQFAPQRGLLVVEIPNDHLITAKWPQVDPKWYDDAIESQFSKFASVLGALREIRARQNIAPRKQIAFTVRCDEETTRLLSPMSGYFLSMASAELASIGRNVEPPKPNATFVLPDMEIYVDLKGLIDVAAEIKRLEKEKANVQNQIIGKQGKLNNSAFTDKAPAEIVDRERTSLAQLKEQLKTLKEALEDLAKQA